MSVWLDYTDVVGDLDSDSYGYGDKQRSCFSFLPVLHIWLCVFQSPLNDVPPPLFRGKVWGGTMLEPRRSTWCGMAIISLGSSHASRESISLEMSLPRGDSYPKDGVE